MNINIFDPKFWGGSFWTGLGVIATIASCILGPLFSILFDRIFGKKDNQERIYDAYKAIFLPDSSLGVVESFVFLPLQAATAYLFYLVLLRLFLVSQISPDTLLTSSFIAVLIVTWGLSIAKHKSFAKLLAFQFCLTFVLFWLFVIGQKGNAPITKNFNWVKHAVGQNLSIDVKQFPLVASLRNINLSSIPTDFHVANPNIVRGQFLLIYALTLIFCLFCYTLYKRHRASRFSAFIRLNDKQRKEQFELLDYQIKQEALELSKLATQEKEADLKLKEEQKDLILQRDKLALEKEHLEVELIRSEFERKQALEQDEEKLEKERLVVAAARLDLEKQQMQLELEKQRMEMESVRLDLEKKRAQYALDLSASLIDTLYSLNGDPVMRVELLRNTLPAFRELGHPGKESTTIILDHLLQAQQQPITIATTVVPQQTVISQP